MRRFVAFAVLSLTAAGCMGGDGEGVSREDFIARADDVCGTYQVRLSRIPRPTTASPTELGTFLERALPIAREQGEKLDDLPKPSDEGDRDQVEQLLALLEQELDFNQSALDAARAGDQAALDSALQQGAAVSAEAGRLAEDFGFVVCARRI